jgi:hypothetical protein
MNIGERISFISSAFIGSLIFIAGIALLATNMLYEQIPKPNRTWLGIVFIVYGIYRGYRAKLQYDRMKHENRSN